MGALAPGTGMDGNAQGSGAGQDNAQSAITQTMGKLRDLGGSLQDLGKSNPSFAPEVQQMQQILKRLIVKAGAQGPQQTPSADQVPGGG